MANEQKLVRFGDSLLLDKIATGGMAVVYSARVLGIRGFSRLVAIKQIHSHLVDRQQFMRMFSDEAKIASRLVHPNIVQIYELGQAEGLPYIAMEHVAGQDLYQVMQRLAELGEVCPWPFAIRVALDLARGLHHAHEFQSPGGHAQAIVHRDVSPRNILLSYAGDIKLTDFGVARARDREEHTEHGVIKGKVRYMSPEMALGRPLDRRSDLFSLGVVFAELLTMTPYRTGESDIAILNSIRDGGITGSRFSALPAELQQVLQRTLSGNPDDRYPTAEAFRLELEAHAKGPIQAMSNDEIGSFVRGLFTAELNEHRRREAQIDEMLARGLSLPAADSQEPLPRDLSPAGPEPSQQGDLLTTSFTRLFAEIHRDGQTGRLDIRRDPVEKSIFFAAGQPLFVQSNVKRELFGEYLVAQGLLSRETLKKSLGISANRGLRLMDVLLRTKVIPPSELYRALANQVTERILNLFTWNEGSFEFYREVKAPAGGTPLKLQSLTLIHEGVMELIPLAAIRRALGPRTAVVHHRNQPVPDGLIFTGREQRILQEIEAEPTTIAELCRHHAGEERVLRLLYLLRELDLVNVEGAE